MNLETCVVTAQASEALECEVEVAWALGYKVGEMEGRSEGRKEH